MKEFLHHMQVYLLLDIALMHPEAEPEARHFSTPKIKNKLIKSFRNT